MRNGSRCNGNRAEARPPVVGLITGSGTYALPELARAELHAVETEFGFAEVTAGLLAGLEVLHVSRHGNGHVRLSNHVSHRANIAALSVMGADCVIALTICGGVDDTLRLGDLVVFDDLYFPSNRLPDGSLCTFHVEPGHAGRAHWIFDRPFSEAVRTALLDGARSVCRPVRAGGCYGHVDGPRFNTAAEIAALRAVGVTAVSQTGGPEAVLAGEAQLPLALLGYVTDWANGAGPESTPVEELLSNMVSSVGVFAEVVVEALARLRRAELETCGVVYGFQRDPGIFRSGQPPAGLSRPRAYLRPLAPGDRTAT